MAVVKLEQSPFPPGWDGVTLENVGLPQQRPDVGTYGRYDWSGLPALPVSLDGTFSWLLQARVRDRHIGMELKDDIDRTFLQLKQACAFAGVLLPLSFLRFFATPRLRARIRSTTDCYLDLAEGPVPSSVGDGALIRFLADSQACVFWYLFVPAGLSDHAIVSTPGYYYGPDAESAGFEQEVDLAEIVFCAESFEAFLCRFWIENELWFSGYEGTPVSEIGRRYVDAYRASPPDPLYR